MKKSGANITVNTVVRKPNPSRFQPGKKPGPGRPKGRLSDATLQIRKFSQDLFSGLFKDPKYKAALRDRILRGKEHPAIIQTLLAYGYGKPPDKFIVSNPDGSPLEGAARREELVERLCNRFTQVVVQRTAAPGVQPPVLGGAGGPVLELAAGGTAEPADPAGGLDHLADPGGPGIRETA